MRKLATLINVMVLAVVFFLAGTTSSMAGGKVRGTVSIFSGTYQQFPPGTPGTTSGPFMCPSGETLSIVTTVVYFSDGICDDVQPNSAGLPACDGRFTTRGEECSDPTPFGRDIKIDGGPFSVLSVTSRGQIEFCFASGASPALPADCWGAGGTPGTTVGMVYATGTTLSEVRLIPGLTGSPASVTSETTLTSTTMFTDVNGIKVDANMFDGAITHATAEPNAAPPACGFTVTPGPGSPGFGPLSGCGAAGVSVKGKK